MDETTVKEIDKQLRKYYRLPGYFVIAQLVLTIIILVLQFLKIISSNMVIGFVGVILVIVLTGHYKCRQKRDVLLAKKLEIMKSWVKEVS